MTIGFKTKTEDTPSAGPWHLIYLLRLDSRGPSNPTYSKNFERPHRNTFELGLCYPLAHQFQFMFLF